jgi:hypothetical protein
VLAPFDVSWAQVLVSGANFVDSSDAVCRFDDFTSPAVFLNASAVECYTPSHATGFVTVEYSNNGVSFTAAGLAFEYYMPMLASAVKPLYATASGGTLITVSGAAFTARAVAPSCRIGGLEAPAEYTGTLCSLYDGTVCSAWNATALTCRAPAHAPGAHAVEISLDQVLSPLPPSLPPCPSHSDWPRNRPLGGCTKPLLHACMLTPRRVFVRR